MRRRRSNPKHIKRVDHEHWVDWKSFQYCVSQSVQNVTLLNIFLKKTAFIISLLARVYTEELGSDFKIWNQSNSFEHREPEISLMSSIDSGWFGSRATMRWSKQDGVLLYTLHRRSYHHYHQWRRNDGFKWKLTQSQGFPFHHFCTIHSNHLTNNMILCVHVFGPCCLTPYAQQSPHRGTSQISFFIGKTTTTTTNNNNNNNKTTPKILFLLQNRWSLDSNYAYI